MEYNHRYLIDYISDHLPDGGRALDYGCGKGGVIVGALAKNIDVYGADIFYKDGRIRGYVEKQGLLNTRVKEIVDGNTGFPSDYFDLVVSNQVFEHVENLDSALEEIARVLKPGGTLYALFPVRETWWEGHFGIPFLHLLSPKSQFRLLYARIWHALDMGYHHANRDGSEWASNVCNWIDTNPHYRSMHKVVKLLEKHFNRIRHSEEEYLKIRFCKSPGILNKCLSFLSNLPLAKQSLVVMYRRRAGIILTVCKPTQ